MRLSRSGTVPNDQNAYRGGLRDVNPRVKSHNLRMAFVQCCTSCRLCILLNEHFSEHEQSSDLLSPLDTVDSIFLRLASV